MLLTLTLYDPRRKVYIFLPSGIENTRTTVICLEADPGHSTPEGGTWWDVAIPEVSEKAGVQAAREAYEEKQKEQPY